MKLEASARTTSSSYAAACLPYQPSGEGTALASPCFVLSAPANSRAVAPAPLNLKIAQLGSEAKGLRRVWANLKNATLARPRRIHLRIYEKGILISATVLNLAS